ncbi:hypothetical protein ACRARG_11115 [Pseudooceanicola sp. C21-150M6]|uniref:hypothetical protein n=1 Tax=Pseudooceanicola sp. C21-150M6 TaxID=3434355 RepID=UPI003D7F4AC9
MLPLLFLVIGTVLGLIIYLALVRRDPDSGFFPLLGPAVVVLGIAGFAMLRLLPLDAGVNPTRVLLAIALLWLGWVALLAFLSQAILRRIPASYPAPTIGGAVMTLAPALGYIAARTLI